MITPTLVVLAFTGAAIIGSWAYFRRWEMKRPPIGVMNLWDVAFTFVAILIIPFLYIALPRPATVVLLFVETASLLYFLFEPVLVRRLAILAAALAIAGLNVLVAWRFGGDSPTFMAVNNAVLALVVIGVTNLWVQSGLKARNMAILGVGLIAFDFVATSMLPVMKNMMDTMSLQPFMPMFVWPLTPGPGWTGWGLGDTLMAAGFPLVMYKAYGRGAGLTAMALSVLAFVAIDLVLASGVLGVHLMPAMVVFGPLMAAQYVVWRRRLGPERRVREYRAGVVLPRGRSS